MNQWECILTLSQTGCTSHQASSLDQHRCRSKAPSQVCSSMPACPRTLEEQNPILVKKSCMTRRPVPGTLSADQKFMGRVERGGRARGPETADDHTDSEWRPPGAVSRPLPQGSDGFLCPSCTAPPHSRLREAQRGALRISDPPAVCGTCRPEEGRTSRGSPAPEVCGLARGRSYDR
ncbi:unnamed protein product [Boreogadus saida]